ncbi:MAG: cytochrome d ubiquinol oxidase subunit II [Candidatus Cryptobacteroides sp.]
MITYEFLQQYWWLIISLLGGLLVFLLFVQGGNAMIFLAGRSEEEKQLIVNSTGRKWEFTFTTLVLFGGAFFASFPLFYSTSFGGAYWVWILILITFVLQAVSYEFQNKAGNILGKTTFRVFLTINGCLAPLLIGTAVGTFFTGSEFIVNKDAASDVLQPVISTWANSWHGLEAVANPFNLELGLAVMFLTMCCGALYLINNVDDAELTVSLKRRLSFTFVCFLIFLVFVLVHLATMYGFAVDADGKVFMEKGKYLHNFLQMPAVLAVFIAGAALIVTGIVLTLVRSNFRKGIWFTAPGIVLTVMALFMVAGFNGTAYYPSTADLQSSLTLQNSCSSEFTLRTMSVVSLIIPFVIAYIAYAWYKIDRKSLTRKELESADHKY